MPWSNRPTRTSTPQHRAWAQQVKRNAGGRCQIRLPGCEGYADHADHIQPVAEGGAEYDPLNGQGACTYCHAIKTGEETQRGRARSYGRARHPTETHPGMVQVTHTERPANHDGPSRWAVAEPTHVED